MSEIGRLWVSIFAKTEELENGIKAVEGDIKRAQQKLNNFSNFMIKRVTVPAIALGGALVALGKYTAEWAGELTDLSVVTGISTDTLQRFRYAEAAAGAETDTLVNSVMKMVDGMKDVNTFGSKVEAFASAYNVELRDMSGNVRAVEDVHGDLLKALAAIEDPQERAIAGFQVFGDEWGKLAPIVDMGVEAMERFQQQEVISQEKIAKMNDFNDVIGEIAHDIQMALMDAAIDLVLVLQEMFDLSPENLREQIGLLRDGIVKIIEKIQEWITWWQSLDEGTKDFYKTVGLLAIVIGPASKLVAGMLGLIDLFILLKAKVVLLSGAAGLGTIAPAASVAAGGVAAAVAIMLAKIALVAAAVVALIALFKAAQEWDISVGAGAGKMGFSNTGGGRSGLPVHQNTALENPYKWYGTFDSGGIVPGPIGRPGLAMVHGGETILPTHKEDNEPGIINNFNIEKMQVRDEKDVEAIARELYRWQNRRGRGVN